MEPIRARKYPRISVDMPTQCSAEEAEEKARALMLGGGGMFLATSQVFPAGSILTVRFRPAKHLPIMEAKAVVRYAVEGQGIGIEFTDIQPEHRQSILRLIHHRMRERRRFPRVPLATQVTHTEGSFIGFSRDISTGGMFVESNMPLDPGTKLNLRFHLEGEETIVKAEAEALYVVPHVGIGLSFTEVLPEEYQRIQAFVARNSKAVASKSG
jgi:c-di-GMP-binding flagellar brake protein YcgR